MDYVTKERMFSYEFRRRVIELSVYGMSKRRAQRAALYLIDDSREVLANRLAKKLAGSQEKTSEFIEDFKLSGWRRPEFLDEIFENSLYGFEPPKIETKTRKQKSKVS